MELPLFDNGEDEIPLWGCPFHGRIFNSQLRNDANVVIVASWTQPGNVYTHDSVTKLFDNRGWTLYQKMPGVADIERTPEQLAEDTTNNYIWRNDVILSGVGSPEATTTGNMRTYNAPIGGFIYAPDAVNRWLISLGKMVIWTVSGGLILNLNPKRFGVIWGEGEETAIPYSITKTVAEIGQSSAAASGYTYIARVVDILPAGTKAIIQLSQLQNGVASELYATPCGYLLLEMSGTPGTDFAATISVLKTRETTFPNRIDDVNRTLIDPMWDINTTSEVTFDDPGPYPACEGFKRTDYTLSVAPITSGMTKDVLLDATYNYVDHVISMYFDGAGVPQSVLYNKVFSKVGHRTHSVVLVEDTYFIKEEYIPSFVEPIACILSGDILEQTYPAYERDMDVELTWTVSESITVNGVVYSNTATGHWYYNEHDSVENDIVTTTTEESATVTVGGTTYDGLINPESIEGSIASWPEEYMFSEAEFINLIFEVSPGVLRVAGVGFRRYSNNLFGSYWFVRNASNAIVSGSLTAVSKEGNTLVTSLVGLNINTAIQPYGSWNPITKQIVINQVNPVNWA
jgi:hypothetical protein